MSTTGVYFIIFTYMMQMMRSETCCIILSNQQQGIFYIHRQDSTHHGLCYISCGALVETGNSSMGPPAKCVKCQKNKQQHFLVFVH